MPADTAPLKYANPKYFKHLLNIKYVRRQKEAAHSCIYCFQGRSHDLKLYRYTRCKYKIVDFYLSKK